jgi:hypothetical protein
MSTSARLYALLIPGGVCGWLWEFWNYWATAKLATHASVLFSLRGQTWTHPPSRSRYSSLNRGSSCPLAETVN